MPAAIKDLYVEKGVSFSRGFYWYRPLRSEQGVILRDADGRPLQGDPYDLTGWTGRMWVRQTQESAPVVMATTENTNAALPKIVFGLDPEDAGALADPTTGRVDIILPEEVTDALTATRYQYDLRLVDTLGRDHRLLKGAVIVDVGSTPREGILP